MAEDDAIVSHSDEGSPVMEQEDTSGHMLEENVDMDDVDNEETLRVEESPGGRNEKGGTTAADADDTEDRNSLSLGGPIDTLAFCLLDGIFEDPKESTKKRVTVPINRLPAVLGRSHSTTDKGFFGLGKVKALSREQCRIDYRTAIGSGSGSGTGGSGQLEQDDPNKDSFTWKRNNSNSEKQTTAELSNPTKLDLSNKAGFFVITCLGKNRITVNGERVEQGQTAVLPTGSTIRISHYSLYFFLPIEASTKTMQLPDTVSSTTTAQTGGANKRKSTSSSAASITTTSGSGGPLKKSKIAAGGWPTLQAELDSMSVDALLEHLEAGMETENWDRRQQLVGSTLSYRAVLAAARSKIIQASAKANGGASRSEIMNWIEKSEKFGKWRALMLTKLEIKSYQASITKALIRAEFERTGTSGRYIKWLLPKSILKEIKDNKKKKAEMGSGDEEDSKQQDTESSQKKEESSEEESGDDEDSKKQDSTSQKKEESSEEESGDDEDSKKEDTTSHKKPESEEESEEEDNDQDDPSREEPTGNDGDNNDMNESQESECDI